MSEVKKLRPLKVVDSVWLNRWRKDTNEPGWDYSAEMRLQEELRDSITGNGCLVRISGEKDDRLKWPEICRLREAVSKAYPRSVFGKYGDILYHYWW